MAKAEEWCLVNFAINCKKITFGIISRSVNTNKQVIGSYFDKKGENCDKNRKNFQLFLLNLLHYFQLCFIIKAPKWWKMV